MANRNFNGIQINQSVTIVETAGKDMEDCRNRILVYDDKGDVVLAEDGTKPFVGVALIEAGVNDISSEDSGKVAAGEDVDVQIKDIGYVLSGTDIAKGVEVTAGAEGLAVPAAAGDYIVGIALGAAEKMSIAGSRSSSIRKSAVLEITKKIAMVVMRIRENRRTR